MTIAIGILTAQGYISFTPSTDGKTVNLEYRSGQGAWETVQLPGLEEAITAIVQNVLAGGSGGTTPTPPSDEHPYGIQPSPTASYVEQIKAALIADGKNLQGPCGAFEICRNVAMGLRATGCGLLEKKYGNMCQERSTDIVCYKDYAAAAARLVDILGDAGGMNNCMWAEKGPEDNVELDRWKDPAESTPTEGGNPRATAAVPTGRKR